MKKLKHIIIGWAKAMGWISTGNAEKKLSKLRMKICGICEHSQHSKVLRFINGEAIHDNGLQCGKCKCPCLEKSLVVDEKCPINKW